MRGIMRRGRLLGGCVGCWLNQDCPTLGSTSAAHSGKLLFVVLVGNVDVDVDGDGDGDERYSYAFSADLPAPKLAPRKLLLRLSRQG
jgi:hypothetical protein